MSLNKVLEHLDLTELPRNLVSIVVGGSQIYAPDPYSDVDLGIIWQEMPTLDERKELLEYFACLEVLNLKEDSPGHPDLGRSDNVTCAGVKVDLIHLSLEQIERCRQVLEQKPGLHLQYQALFWNLKHGQYIYGPKMPELAYPQLLKEVTLKTQRPQIYPQDLELARDRKDEFFYLQTQAQIQRAEFLIFLSEHEEFFVSFKQTQKQRERLGAGGSRAGGDASRKSDHSFSRKRLGKSGWL